MPGKFTMRADNAPEVLEWGQLRWLSAPTATRAKQLTVLNVSFGPGKGHDFHKHPDQEEVIFVVSGEVEQWAGREKRILGPGDSCFLPAGEVHASFNVGSEDVNIVAILGPCRGASGYEVVDVSGEAEWKALRR